MAATSTLTVIVSMLSIAFTTTLPICLLTPHLVEHCHALFSIISFQQVGGTPSIAFLEQFCRVTKPDVNGET